MESDIKGHRGDTRKKHVAIDEDLWAQCQALPAVYQGKLPARIGTVDGCQVYVVDANKIMTTHDMDFTQGGNGLEDPQLCGKSVIVLDDRVRGDDWPFIVYHETHERRSMKKGATYEAAHDKANAGERELRQRFAREKKNPPPYKPATKVAGYVSTPTPKQCGTCHYLTGGWLCRQDKVKEDEQVKTDSTTGLKIVHPQDGCCNFWETRS